MTSVEEKIVNNVVNTHYIDLPEEAVSIAKKSIIDTFASIVAGSKVFSTKIIIEQVKEWGGRGESSIINYGEKIPCHNAALVNSTMARTVEFDDVHERGCVHPSATVVPVAFSIAEKLKNVDGKSLLTATILGTDLICRMAKANGIPTAITGLSTTYLCGTFGAAVTAGRLMKLNKREMWNALGIAYSQTAGNSQCMVDGALTVRLQQGLSASAGVTSALFASRGITGAKNLLEGKFGYFNTYQRGCYDRRELIENLGETFEGVNVTIKPYPCCRHTHTSIEALLTILKQNEIPVGDIEKITVKVNRQGFNLCGKPLKQKRHPQEQPQAQFSLPYVVGTVAVKRGVSLDDFSPEALNNRKVIEVAEKTIPMVDPRIEEESGSGITSAIVELKTRAGRKYSKYVVFAKGHPENPVSIDEEKDKLRKCMHYAARPIPEQNIEKLLDKVCQLEKVNDVNEIVELLTP